MIYSPEQMEKLRRAYKRIPPEVIEDVAEFCFANAPTNGPREEGRRDAWLHFNNFINLTREQLAQLFAGQGVVLTQEE